MKVLRDTDWILYSLTTDGFMFQHRKFKDDFLLVKKAKFINVERNVVFFLDASAKVKVSVSYSSRYLIEQSYSQFICLLDNALALMKSWNLTATTICNG